MLSSVPLLPFARCHFHPAEILSYHIWAATMNLPLIPDGWSLSHWYLIIFAALQFLVSLHFFFFFSKIQGEREAPWETLHPVLEPQSPLLPTAPLSLVSLWVFNWLFTRDPAMVRAPQTPLPEHSHFLPPPSYIFTLATWNMACKGTQIAFLTDNNPTFPQICHLKGLSKAIQVAIQKPHLGDLSEMRVWLSKSFSAL